MKQHYYITNGLLLQAYLPFFFSTKFYKQNLNKCHFRCKPFSLKCCTDFLTIGIKLFEDLIERYISSNFSVKSTTSPATRWILLVLSSISTIWHNCKNVKTRRMAWISKCFSKLNPLKIFIEPYIFYCVKCHNWKLFACKTIANTHLHWFDIHAYTVYSL